MSKRGQDPPPSDPMSAPNKYRSPKLFYPPLPQGRSQRRAPREMVCRICRSSVSWLLPWRERNCRVRCERIGDHDAESEVWPSVGMPDRQPSEYTAQTGTHTPLRPRAYLSTGTCIYLSFLSRKHRNAIWQSHTADRTVRSQWYWTLPKIHKNDKKIIASDQIKSEKLRNEIIIHIRL